jgi:formylglycine-generating enzyme required for sulfatase activity
MWRASTIALAMIFALALAPAASAKRVALVVGINTYDNLGPGLQLRKALNDARAVAATLKEIGFQVVAAENTQRNDFLRAWQRFLDLVQPGDVTALYFAGHGFEINGTNYLLVRDAPQVADGEDVLRESAIRFAGLLDRLKDKQAQVSLFFLDACRDSPYANKNSKRSIGGTRGLVREDPPKGALVLMSAGAGQSALDSLSTSDTNPNSVYTRNLLPLLKEPGLEIIDLAKRVRSDVETLAASIHYEQRPAFYDELSGNFYLVAAPEAPQAAISAGPTLSEAAQAWSVTKDTASQAILEAFVRQFGSTFYGELARARIADLKRTQTAVATVPPVSPPLPSAPPSSFGREPLDEAGKAWSGISNTTDPAVLEAFIRQFRDSTFAALAQKRLKELNGAKAAVAVAPSASVPQLPPAVPRPPSAFETAQAWVTVKNTDNAAELETFLSRFGESIYADMARARLSELKRTQVAVVVPPAPAPPTRVTPAVVAPAAPVPAPLTNVTPAVGIFPPPSAAAPLTAAQERTLRPRDKFKECENCPEMVVVPSGAFTMGSPASEEGRSTEESPPYRVTIAKPFAVGEFSVTFDEWDACVSAGGCNGYRPADDNRHRGRYPVTNVSWDDAQAYIAWLSKTTGKTYRLLSEAEREYATRGGAQTPFWFGSSISTTQANYDGGSSYGGGAKGEYRGHTLPVEMFEANPFGLYQMHGNVNDWVADCWNASYQGAPADGSARTAQSCARHVLRGGSWYDPPAMLRAAHRAGFYPGYRSGSIGFRVARSLGS